MNIDVLCNDGSPLGVTSKDLWGEGGRGVGVGGAEYALITLCEEWKKAGHRVRLYNDPLNPRDTKFGQYPIGSFLSNEDRDEVSKILLLTWTKLFVYPPFIKHIFMVHMA
jgi:hypothetical protein